MKTLKEFIEENENRFDFDIIEEEILDDGWKYFHWVVEICFDGRKMEIDYYGGKCVTNIDLPGVLESLHSDYWCLENTDGLFSFLVEFGYTGDAEAMHAGKDAFEGIQKNNEKLSYLFGDEFENFVCCSLD